MAKDTTYRGKSTFQRTRRNRMLWSIGLTLIALVAVAWLVLGTIKREVRYSINETLSIQRDTLSRSLSDWLDARRKLVDTISERAVVVAWIRSALEGDQEAQNWLDATLMHFVSSLSFEGYLVVNP